MLQRLKVMVQSIRERLGRPAAEFGSRAADATGAGMARAASGIAGAKVVLVVAGVTVIAAYTLYQHPPLENIGRGEVGVRINRFTGDISEWREGNVLVLPGLHDIRVFALRDQTYQPEQIRRAEGAAPLQSVEGLSFGVVLSVRYALDATKLRATSKTLPDNISGEVVEPAVQGVIYKVFARYTVREIFSTKRVEIQQAIEKELTDKMAA